MQHDGARGLGLRHDFERKLGQRRQCAIGARLQLAHVVAGDVLDHLAAGLPDVAEAVHGGKAEDVVAGRSGAHAAGAGQVAGDHAAQGLNALPPPSRARQSGGSKASICRFFLSSASIAASGSPGRAVRTSSAGSYATIPFSRDTSRTMIRLHRAAERALGAAGDDFERTAFRGGPGDGLGRLLGVRRLQQRHCRSPQKRGRSGKASLPAWTCMRPSSAQRHNCGNTLPGLSSPSESKAHFSRCC